VTRINVYQIGVGSFGRNGFEKIIEMHNHFEEHDIRLKGLCEKDFEKREKAEKFAEAHDIELDLFEDVEEMYRKASSEDEEVLIYDASPADIHSKHIYSSLQYGFFHLAEKPPSLEREDHLKEKKLAEQKDVFWKVDFIERENPVVKKALELVEENDIDEIEVFRESSVGIQKIMNPVERRGVKGGDILDKMIHEVYVLDFLEEAGLEPELELEQAETKYFMPKDFNSEKLMSIRGGYVQETDDAATAQTEAVFDADGVEVSFHSSWIGLSDECRLEAKKIRDITGDTVFNRKFSEIDETAFLNEEARFFVVRGDRDLVGDMLNRKLYDLETGEEIELDYYIHDQFYRVIERSVRKAAGEEVEDISDKETDIFMNAIFDLRDSVSGEDYLDELDRSLEKIDSLTVTDRKMFEAERKNVLAG